MMLSCDLVMTIARPIARPPWLTTVCTASGPLSVTATVRPQADGSTRVEFKTSGDASGALSQPVLGAYNARMGR